jgi:hypothetical protein
MNSFGEINANYKLRIQKSGEDDGEDGFSMEITRELVDLVDLVHRILCLDLNKLLSGPANQSTVKEERDAFQDILKDLNKFKERKEKSSKMHEFCGRIDDNVGLVLQGLQGMNFFVGLGEGSVGEGRVLVGKIPVSSIPNQKYVQASTAQKEKPETSPSPVLHPPLPTHAEDRLLKRPSLGLYNESHTPPGLRQELWTMEELKNVAEEAKNLNVVFEIDVDGKVVFISKSVELVFGEPFFVGIRWNDSDFSWNTVIGYTPQSITGSTSLPFLPRDSSGYHYFTSGLKKLNETPNITMNVSFKAKRQDGLGLLMEANGIQGENGCSIWVTRPVALLGSKWKDLHQVVLSPVRQGRPDSEASSSQPPDLSSASPLLHELSLDPLNMDLALCHICERVIPVLIFENHNSLCLQVHKAEMDLTMAQDSMAGIRLNLSKQVQFLKDELELEKIEKEKEEDGVREQKMYIECLEQLYSLSNRFSERFEKAYLVTEKEINYAKSRTSSGQANGRNDEMSELQDWQCPSMSLFFPARELEFKTSNMSTVKSELETVGEALWIMVSDFYEKLGSLKDKIVELRRATEEYAEAVLQEENIKLQITMKAEEAMHATEDSKDPLRFSLSSSAGAALEPVDLFEKSSSHESKSSGMFLEDGGRRDPLVSPVMESSTSNDAESSVGSSRKNSLRPPQPSNSSRRSSRFPRIVVNTEKTVDLQTLGTSIGTAGSLEVSQHSSETPVSPVLSNASFIHHRSMPSIKDYEIVKPISKGAFGSVYLAKKKVTGDYFAIKVLKKADMIAKNQVTNIRAERMILTQLDSPYVVKLFYSFQSRNHLYLVMEYLNGGDCASLLKAVGCLDEKWAKQYVAEMILGIEFLHSRGIVHRYDQLYFS